jgi:hypothetical protein
VLKDNTVQVQVQVKDLPLFQQQDLELGPHLTVVLDNQSYYEVYDASQPLTLDDLEPGTHSLRVFASRPWHESFKNGGAYAQTTFHVFTKTPENNPSGDRPLLTYNWPRDTVRAEPVLLDFYLTNAPLHLVAQERADDDILDWKIRCTINGQSFVFDQWGPIYLKGFKPGKNWVQVELIDETGNLIPNAYNNTVRLITYEPGGQDTLSKLVRSDVSLKDVRGIVDPDYVPEIPEPEVTEPEITEPEVPEADVTEPEVTEPEVTEPEPSEPEEAEPSLPEAAESEPVPTQPAQPGLTEPESQTRPQPTPSPTSKAAPEPTTEPEPAPSPEPTSKESSTEPTAKPGETKPSAATEAEAEPTEPESSEPESSEPESLEPTEPTPERSPSAPKKTDTETGAPLAPETEPGMIPEIVPDVDSSTDAETPPQPSPPSIRERASQWQKRIMNRIQQRLSQPQAPAPSAPDSESEQPDSASDSSPSPSDSTIDESESVEEAPDPSEAAPAPEPLE